MRRSFTNTEGRAIPACTCSIKIAEQLGGAPIVTVERADPRCCFHELLDELLHEGNEEEAVVLAHHEAERQTSIYEAKRQREATARRAEKGPRPGALTHRPFEALLQRR